MAAMSGVMQLSLQHISHQCNLQWIIEENEASMKYVEIWLFVHRKWRLL
jgi:hypothetical protein